MTFIRLKRRQSKNGETFYAYLVENSWSNDKRQSKQKVKEYLGKVCKPTKKDVDFFEYRKVTDPDSYFANTFSCIVKDLIAWELHQHDMMTVSLDYENAEMKGEPAVIAMNEGYLCNHTLKNLLCLEQQGLEEHQMGYALAKALIEAGIQVPKEVFVALYEKAPKAKGEFD